MLPSLSIAHVKREKRFYGVEYLRVVGELPSLAYASRLVSMGFEKRFGCILKRRRQGSKRRVYGNVRV